MEWQNATNDTAEAWDRTGTLTGTYTKMKTNVGKKMSNMYMIKQKDGVTVGVWGSVIVDNAFENIEIGNEVQLKFLGKKVGKNGNEFNDYEILFKPAEFRPATAEVAPTQEVAPEFNPSEADQRSDDEPDITQMPF